MKHLCSFLLLVFILTACAPAAPAAPVPTATVVPPTGTPEPADTPTITPTAEPTATLTPTLVPMPEGWSAIAETKEMGGFQVVVNEKGKGAVFLNNIWYSADPNGCYHKGLLSESVQKNPELYDLRSRLYQRNVFLDDKLIQEGTYLYTVGRYGENWGDHFGTWGPGHGGNSQFWKYEYDGIIWQQALCYEKITKRWYHMLDVVLPMPVPILDETLFTRLGVGWFDSSGDYHTFTYYQEMSFEKIVNNREMMVSKGLVYPASVEKKPGGLEEAFEMWNGLITERKHVEISIPAYLIINSTKTLDSSFETKLRKVVVDVPLENERHWSTNLADPELINWAIDDKSSLKFFTDTKNLEIWETLEEGKSRADDNKWTRYMQKAKTGDLPVMFIRTISIPKGPQ